MSPWWDKNWFKEDYLRQFHTPRTSHMDVDIRRGYSIKDWLFLFQSRPDFRLKIYSLPVLHHVLLGSLTVTIRGGILSRSLHALFEEVALHFHAKDCLIIAHSQCAADLVRFHEVFFTFNIVLITRHFFFERGASHCEMKKKLFFLLLFVFFCTSFSVRKWKLQRNYKNESPRKASPWSSIRQVMETVFTTRPHIN